MHDPCSGRLPSMYGRCGCGNTCPVLVYISWYCIRYTPIFRGGISNISCAFVRTEKGRPAISTDKDSSDTTFFTDLALACSESTNWRNTKPTKRLFERRLPSIFRIHREQSPISIVG